MDGSFLFYLIIGILVFEFLFELVLDRLNSNSFNKSIPAELEDVFDKSDYDKARQYQQDRDRFSLIQDIFSFTVTILFLALGGFGWLDNWVGAITANSILQALLFFGILSAANSIIGIPFSYYGTFVIESKYGFNKSTPAIFFTDLIKGMVISAILGTAIVSALIFFIEKTGSQFWIYAWLLFVSLIVFMNLFYSKLIVPLFNKQQPLDQGSLRQAIEGYAQKAQFDLTNIFVMDGSKRSTKANAYFSGFGKQKRITLFDTLINDLDEDEVVAVLAHEVGHYKRKHTIINMVVSIVLTALTLFLLSLFINNPALSLALGANQPSYHLALIAFFLLYSPISTITGIAMNYLSRKFEFQADDYAKNTFKKQPMVSALKKLAKNNLVNLTPHPAYVFVHSSHPPLFERIRNLQA